jgi:hypothetical protein
MGPTLIGPTSIGLTSIGLTLPVCEIGDTNDPWLT